MMYNAKRLKYNRSEIYMGKKKLILAGIVSAGVLGTAALTNLHSIFAEASEETTQTAETTK